MGKRHAWRLGYVPGQHLLEAGALPVRRLPAPVEKDLGAVRFGLAPGDVCVLSLEPGERAGKSR
jgi:hypothetical protein